ncbi:MAG: hypothetical protein KJ737_07425 [Proteobacteria bacterium]|nr:hypothetical protein [Pseudomonadota bacterium]
MAKAFRCRLIPLIGIILLTGFLVMAAGCSTKKHKEVNNMDYQNVTQDISGIMVQNLDGEAVELESLWKNRRIVLTFLRHFG